MNCLWAAEKGREKAAYGFATVVVDNIEVPSETLLEILAQKFSVLAGVKSESTILGGE